MRWRLRDPSPEHRRALAEYTGRHAAVSGDEAGAASREAGTPADASHEAGAPADAAADAPADANAKPAGPEQPTTDLGEPVTSENRQ